MTWADFKYSVEDQGIKDTDILDYVDTTADWAILLKVEVITIDGERHVRIWD